MSTIRNETGTSATISTGAASALLGTSGLLNRTAAPGFSSPAEEFACMLAGVPAEYQPLECRLLWVIEGTALAYPTEELGPRHTVTAAVVLAYDTKQAAYTGTNRRRRNDPTIVWQAELPAAVLPLVCAVELLHFFSAPMEDDGRLTKQSWHKTDPFQHPLYRAASSGNATCSTIAEQAATGKLQQQSARRRQCSMAATQLLMYLDSRNLPYTLPRGRVVDFSGVRILAEPVATLDADAQLEVLMVVGRTMPTQLLAQAFPAIVEQVGGMVRNLSDALEGQLLDLTAENISEVLPGRLAQAKKYLSDPIGWVGDAENREARRRRALTVPRPLLEQQWPRLAMPLTGIPLPAGSDGVARAAWVWANYNAEISSVAKVFDPLPQHLRIMLLRTTGSRQYQILKVVKKAGDN